MIKRICRLLLGSSVLLLLAGCNSSRASSEVQTYAWPLGTSSPEDTVTQIFAEKFVEEVDRLSEGSMRIEIYANSLMGGDRELLESCEEGDIPFVVQNTAPQVSFMDEIAVFDLPCAFDTIEDVRKAVDGENFYSLIEEVYKGGGYKLLSFADQEYRVMSTNVKVQELADFKGQKIRTMENSYHLDFWKAIGANPTPMAFSEVYIGLQQNVIDAQENPYEVIVSGKLYEQQDYVIKTNHLPHLITLIVSDEFFQGLTEEQQEVIIEASELAKQYAREQSDARIAERIETMEATGTEIVELTPEVIQEIRDASADIYETIREQVGDELMDAYLGN